MEQTPTFRCIKKYPFLDTKKGDIIKMSEHSKEELDNDERSKNWRDFFEEISLEEELSLLK